MKQIKLIFLLSFITISIQLSSKNVELNRHGEILAFEYYNINTKTYQIDFLNESQYGNDEQFNSINKNVTQNTIFKIEETKIRNYDIRHLVINVGNTEFNNRSLNNFLSSLNSEITNTDSIITLNLKVHYSNTIQSDSFLITPLLFKPLKNLKSIQLVNNNSFTIIPNDISFKLNALVDLHLEYYGQNSLPDYLISNNLEEMELKIKCKNDSFIFPSLINLNNKDSKYGCRIKIIFYESNIKYLNINMKKSKVYEFKILSDQISNLMDVVLDSGIVLSMNLLDSEITYMRSLLAIESLQINGNNGLINDLGIILTKKKNLKNILTNQKGSVCINNLGVSYQSLMRMHFEFSILEYRQFDYFRKRKTPNRKVFRPRLRIYFSKYKGKSFINNCYKNTYLN
jgi:hypothetical protein